MKRWLFWFMAFGMLACKKDQATVPVLPGEQDSLLLQDSRTEGTPNTSLESRMLRLENNSLKSKDSIYSKATLQYTSDSLLQILILDGKTSITGRVKAITQSALYRNNKRLNGPKLEGMSIQTTSLGPDALRIYTYLPEKQKVSAHLVRIKGDTISLSEDSIRDNYTFSLLRQKRFQMPRTTDHSYFLRHRDRERKGDIQLLDLFETTRIFKDSIPLFSKPLDLPVETLLGYRDSLTGKWLVSYTDSIPRALLLSGSIHGQHVQGELFSIFKNDSTLIRETHLKKTLLDHRHLVSFEHTRIKDSISWNKDFQFSLHRSDTLKELRHYQQYYPQLRDSVFFAYGPFFTLNNTRVQWQYRLSYDKSRAVQEYFTPLILHQANLITEGRRSLLLLPKTSDLFQKADFTKLFYPGEELRMADLNGDNFRDLLIREGKDRMGNYRIHVFLWDPAQKDFTEASELNGADIDGNPHILTTPPTLIYRNKTGDGGFSATVIQPKGKLKAERVIYYTEKQGELARVLFQRISGNRITEKGAVSDAPVNWPWPTHEQLFFNWILGRSGSEEVKSP